MPYRAKTFRAALFLVISLQLVVSKGGNLSCFISNFHEKSRRYVHINGINRCHSKGMRLWKWNPPDLKYFHSNKYMAHVDNEILEEDILNSTNQIAEEIDDKSLGAYIVQKKQRNSRANKGTDTKTSAVSE